jgi:hypothetical protein
MHGRSERYRSVAGSKITLNLFSANKVGRQYPRLGEAGGSRRLCRHPSAQRSALRRKFVHLAQCPLVIAPYSYSTCGVRAHFSLIFIMTKLLIRHGEVLTPFGLSPSINSGKPCRRPLSFRQAQGERTSNIIWPDQ